MKIVVIWLIISANDTFLNETSWDADARWTACAESETHHPPMLQPKMERNVGLQIKHDLAAVNVKRKVHIHW